MLFPTLLITNLWKLVLCINSFAAFPLQTASLDCGEGKILP